MKAVRKAVRRVMPVLGMLALSGCAPTSGDSPAMSESCGEPPASWVGGYQRTEWRDEGDGYISQMESNATDTPLESIGDPPSFRVLNCQTGRGSLIADAPGERTTAYDFLDQVRAAKSVSGDLVALARRQRLNARPTVANARSTRAICGCREIYPDIPLEWAKSGG